MMPSDPNPSVRWLRPLFFLVTLAVLALALWPSPASLPVQTGWDKADHVLAFAVLGTIGLWAWPRVQVRVIAGLLAYGALIEVLQSLTLSREADWHDFVADAIGVGLAFVIVRLLFRRVSRV